MAGPEHLEYPEKRHLKGGENNIGFFAKSKNAESMIEEVQNKINNAKESMKLLEQKIEMIDSLDA